MGTFSDNLQCIAHGEVANLGTDLKSVPSLGFYPQHLMGQVRQRLQRFVPLHGRFVINQRPNELFVSFFVDGHSL